MYIKLVGPNHSAAFAGIKHTIGAILLPYFYFQY